MRRNISLLIVFMLLSVFVTACSKPAVDLTAAEMLELGEKYLLELDYEQAVVQFLKVIEVEPMNVRGYMGAAKAYIALDEQDEAVEILRKGLALMPNNDDIQAFLDELTEQASSSEPLPSATTEPISEAESELSPYALDLIGLFEISGYEAVIEEMRSAEFRETLLALTDEPDAFPVICNSEDANGCGFYLINGDLFVYIGGYDLLRSGEGVWLHVNTEDAGYYVFTGSWLDDAPNGEGKIISIKDESTIEREEGHTYSLESIDTGTYSNGLANDSINKRWVMEDGHTHNWNLTADGGIYEVVGSTEWSDAVVGFCTDCDADLSWRSVDGVRGFIQ